jgi:uncharacterized membrane-anchored protein
VSAAQLRAVKVGDAVSETICRQLGLGYVVWLSVADVAAFALLICVVVWTRKDRAYEAAKARRCNDAN